MILSLLGCAYSTEALSHSEVNRVCVTWINVTKEAHLLSTAVERAASARTPFILRHYTNIVLAPCREKEVKAAGPDSRQPAGFCGKASHSFQARAIVSKRQTLPFSPSYKTTFIYNLTPESMMNKNEFHFQYFTLYEKTMSLLAWQWFLFLHVSSLRLTTGLI